MKRAISIIAIGIGTVLLLFVNYSSLAGLWTTGPGPEIPEEVIAEAKSQVSEPVLPAPPAATTEIEGYDERYAEFQVPEVSGWPPQVRMRSKRVLVAREPRVRFKDPSSDEILRWEAEVARLQEEYELALQRQIDQIRARREKEFEEIRTQRAKELCDALESWVKITGGIVGCLVGCVTLFVTVRKERRESQAAKGVGTSRPRNRLSQRAAQQAAAPDGGASKSPKSAQRGRRRG